MGSKGTSTTVSSNAPPQQFLTGYTNALNQAQNVASTPFQGYQGQTVAQLSPDQAAAIGQIEGVTGGAGVQAPYLQQANDYFHQATQPLLTQGMQAKIDQNSGGLVGAAANSLTPGSVQSWENPWTSDVVQATESQFNNQNAQQQSQVTGNAISQGAWGGDRSAVAQALTAGEQARAEAPVIAGLESQGYQTGLQAAQQAAALRTQGATTQSQLGLQGVQAALGANEANAWLGSQAGFGEANLGSEAQSLGLSNASALLQAGGLEQQMAQENLNIPYEQYLAQQAYPFQTAGWFSNIAEGLGGASGGTSSTSVPGPSAASQVAGLGVAGLGLYNAANNAGLFGSGAGTIDGGAFTSAAAGAGAMSGGWDSLAGSFSGWNRGGMVPKRAMGGLAPLPQIGISPVPGAHGLGDASPHPGMTPLITHNYGTTAQTSGGSNVLGTLMDVAAIASHFMARGGAATDHEIRWDGPMVPKRAFGGSNISLSEGAPWWARTEERQSVDRHGLLASPVAGRTDHLAITPETGSYVIPADVVSGLGEGNTLAGAGVVQRMLDSGPHGTRLPPAPRGKGPPRPPPAYRETSQPEMASGGGVPRRAAGGMSPAVGNYIADGGINASTGQGASHTGIQPLDDYLNATEHMASFTPPKTAAPISPVTSPTVPTAQTIDQMVQQAIANQQSSQDAAAQFISSGAKRGGGIPRRAWGGPADGFGDGGDLASDTGADMPLGDVAPARLPDGSYRLNGDGSPPYGPPIYTSPVPPPGGSAPPRRGPPPAPHGMQPHSSGDLSGETAFNYTPQQPDPWLALADAGFSMMAGRSPYALENIGAGAARGLHDYMQQKQQADARNIQAQETQARLAGAAAARQAAVAYQQARLGQEDKALAARTAAENARLGLEGGTLAETRRYHDLQMNKPQVIYGYGPDGKTPGIHTVYPPDANGHVRDVFSPMDTVQAHRAAQGDQRAALAAQRENALEQYRQWQQSHADQTSGEVARWHAWLQQQGATQDDIKMLEGSKDIMGKPTMTPQQAHDASQNLLHQNAPPGARPAQPVPGTQGASAIPSGAIEYLKQHPDLAPQFDQKYGQGASRQYLGSP